MKILAPKEAMRIIMKMLNEQGFYKISASKSGSHYFGKLGSSQRVRVSDHPNPHDDPFRKAVLIDIVVDQPTIENECIYHARRASKAFVRRAA